MRSRYLCLLLMMAFLLLSVPVTIFADTYDYVVSLNVTNSGDTDYDYLPVLVSLNNTQLVDMGYIQADALDTNTLEMLTEIPYCVADDKLTFMLPSILGDQRRTVSYRLGNAPAQSDYWFVSGVGGDSTTADDASLELGSDDFEVEWKGYVDTSVAGTILEKADNYGIEVSEAGTIRGYVQADDVYFYMYPTSDVGGDAGFALNGEATCYECVDDVQDTPDDDTTYLEQYSDTSYIYRTYGLTDPGFAEYDVIDQVDVFFRISGVNVDDEFWVTPCLIIGVDEQCGSEQADTGNSYTSFSKTVTRPGGGDWSYDDFDSLQLKYKGKTTSADYMRTTQSYVRVQYDSIAQVTDTVASGEHTIVLSREGTQLEMTVDGVSAGTDTIDSDPGDNANDLVIDGDIAVATEYAKISKFFPQNRGYEDGNDWPTAGAGAVSAEESHTGTYSYKLVAAGANIAGSYSEYVAVTPSSTISASLWTYASVITEAGFFPMVYLYDGGKVLCAPVSQQQIAYVEVTETGWTYHSVEFALPADCEYVRCGSNWWNVGGDPTGTAYIDDWLLFGGGVQKAWYQPVTIIEGTTLVDRSGVSNDGVITWGSNPGAPSAITVVSSGAVAYTAYTTPGGGDDVEVPAVIEDPGIDVYENTTKDYSGMPAYDIMDATAISLGWSTITTYGIFMMIGAIAGGIAVSVATGSILAGIIGLSVMLIVSAATGILPFWIPLIFGLFAFMAMYIWKRL